MKPNFKLMTLGLLFAGMLALLMPKQVMAAGTASGTSISNTATVDFQVGGVAQTQVSSAPVAFVVDNRVDLNLVTQDGAAVSVSPGSLFANGVYNVLRFRVTNDGNTTQDYALSVVTVTTGGAARFSGNDAFDMDPEPVTTTRIFVNSVRNAVGVYENGTDTANFIDELVADDFVDVFVVLDAPLTATNGQIASYHLLATTHDAGAAGLGAQTTETVGAWVAGTVQVVFADGSGSAGVGTDDDGDGIFSDQDDYLVATADLAIVKASDVIDDGFNVSPNAKAIPGATVEYTIDIDNNGSASATSVQVTDSIPANTDFVVGSVTGGDTVEYSDSGGWGYTPGAGPTDPNVTAIRVTFNSIANGGSDQLTFRVLIE